MASSSYQTFSNRILTDKLFLERVRLFQLDELSPINGETEAIESGFLFIENLDFRLSADDS